MPKLKIDNKQLAESFFDDCRILGIVAPLSDYQFTWHINQLMGLRFRVNNGLEINLKKKSRHYYFPVFEYHVPSASLCYFLYNNQHDGEFLLPEFKHLDFIWLIRDEELCDAEIDALVANLRSMPGVQLVTEIPSSKIVNKQHLVL